MDITVLKFKKRLVYQEIQSTDTKLTIVKVH